MSVSKSLHQSSPSSSLEVEEPEDLEEPDADAEEDLVEPDTVDKPLVVVFCGCKRSLSQLLVVEKEELEA